MTVKYGNLKAVKAGRLKHSIVSSTTFATRFNRFTHGTETSCAKIGSIPALPLSTSQSFMISITRSSNLGTWRREWDFSLLPIIQMMAVAVVLA